MNIEFDGTINDFDPKRQEIIKQLAAKMGIQTPFGFIGNDLVDEAGNAIDGALSMRKFGDLITAIDQGDIGIDQVTSGGQVIYPSQPSGLTGAEQALEAGTTSALSTMGQGAETARGDISSGYNKARDDLQHGREDLIRSSVIANDMAQQSINRGRDDVIRSSMIANDMAQQNLGKGRNDVLTTTAAMQALGSAPLQGFSQAGNAANQTQAALSGAFGRGAQQQAYSDFMSSPGQQYLRDQAEKALLRNSAAIGGLGGGNVRTALQDQAIGMAAQDFNNYYARLGDVSNRGAQASQGLANLTSALGGNAVNQLGGLASQGAGITSSLGGNVASGLVSLNNQGANITGNLGGNLTNQLGSNAQTGANLSYNTGQSLGNTAFNTGLNAATLLSGAGNNMANYRYDTGVNLANTLNSGNAQLATLNQNQGISQADLLGQYTTGLANLLSGTGTQMASGDQALAALIANIATGAGSQYAGLPGIPGTQAAPNNVVSDAGLITQALGGMIPNNNGASSGGGNQLYGYTELPNVANLA